MKHLHSLLARPATFSFSVIMVQLRERQSERQRDLCFKSERERGREGEREGEGGRESETETERDKQTDRDRQTDRQTDSKRARERDIMFQITHREMATVC